MKDIFDFIKHKCNQLPHEQILSNNNEFVNNTAKFCEIYFDGIMCWPRTPAGILANQSCSNDLLKSTQKGLATRQCDDYGNWYVPENFTTSWTNYTQCGSFYIEKAFAANIYTKWIPIIKTVTHFGYILSLVSLIFALVVFINIKRLHCARNKLHINLFLSFVMKASMSLLKDGLFVKGTALMHETIYINGEPIFRLKENYSWMCKAVITLWQYFIMSNYMFLLMEGTYLHNLMFLNLFSENGVLIYCVSGWGLPIIFIVPWIIMKAIHENIVCWTKNKSKYIALLIDAPIAVSVIINFILFTVIVRVLFIKLTSMYIQQRKTKYRKLLRSTLILVPLFGIPYTISVILSFYVATDEILEISWLLFDQTFSSFQGFLASFAYCLLNSEVQTELKRKYNSFKDRNNRKQFKRNRTISHTQQLSIPLTEDLPEIVQNLGSKKQQVQQQDSRKTSDNYF